VLSRVRPYSSTEGVPHGPGTTLTVAAVDIFVVRDGAETLCAAALVTMRNIINRARSADAA
jgi:hypothetical protein